MGFLLTILFLQAAENWDSSVLNIIARSGFVAKGVLVVLLFFSIVSWAIIADKYFALKRVRRQNGQFYRLFRGAGNITELANSALRYRHAPFAKIYLSVFNEITQQGRNDPAGAAPTVKSFMPLSNHVIERAIGRSSLSEQSRLEKNLSFLATTASATPFIGLFGTVWGIINAFEAIGGARSTDLSVVAPGIAEALIATAMGLAAAIPAVIGYNYFLHLIRNLTSEVEEFSMELLGFIEQQRLITK